MDTKNWTYNEFIQTGRDYSEPAEVEIYDSTHAGFRDTRKENEEIIGLLKLQHDDIVIDFGAGTGDFAIQAAPSCKKVIAIDISPAMLHFANKKSDRAGVYNIEWVRSGFLNYQHRGKAAGAVISSFSLHHLPDFWKGIALKRIHQMLRPGGRFFLKDVVINAEQPVESVNAFIEKQAEEGGDFLRDDATGHFRDEFSTYDWVMEGLLIRSGFSIEKKTISEKVIFCYLCRKSG